MIVGDFHLVGIAITPLEADPPLIIDSNTVLSLPVSPECFQPVSWRGSEISKFRSRVQLPQFPPRNPFDADKAPDPFPRVEPFRLCRPERLDHLYRI